MIHAFLGSDTNAGDLHWSILHNIKRPICIIKPGQQFMFSQNYGILEVVNSRFEYRYICRVFPVSSKSNLNIIKVQIEEIKPQCVIDFCSQEYTLSHSSFCAKIKK